MTQAVPHTSAPLLWPLAWALPEGVQAVCSTRVGGVSKTPFDRWNMGDHVHDDPAAVAANRALFQAQLEGAKPVFLNQVHGIDVVKIHAATPNGIMADGCLTQDKHVACTIMVADCLPLLLTDEAGAIVAAAHAGWRGLSDGIIEQTIAAMCVQANVAPQKIHVWLGPCIGPQAFEVGDEVRTAFCANANGADAQRYFKPHPSHSSKWFADLAGLARWRLARLGVGIITGNDGTPDWCTVTQQSRLFSYRRDGVTGRFAASIWRT